MKRSFLFSTLFAALFSINATISPMNSAAKFNPKVKAEFFLAAKIGNLQKIQEMIDQHRPEIVHENDNTGEFPLHIACKNGYLEIAKLLIEHGANRSEKGGILQKTPFGYACRHGHLDIVKYFLEDLELDPNSTEETDGFGWNSFWYSFQGGCIEVVDYLIEKLNINLNFKVDVDHKKLSLFSIVCTNPKDNFALKNHLYGQAKTNLEKNSYKKSCDHYSCTKLELFNHLEREYLKKHSPDEFNALIRETNVVHHAVSEGHYELVKYLIEYVDRDSLDAAGAEIVHCAAKNGHLKIFTYLTDKHIEPNMASARGTKPVHDAAVAGRVEIVKHLVKRRGVSASELDAENGETILHYACKGGNFGLPWQNEKQEKHEELITYLIEEKGVSPREKNLKTGDEPIHYAVFGGNLNTLKLLTQKYGADIYDEQHSVDINAKNNKGETPLCKALRPESPLNKHLIEHIAIYLIENGTEITYDEIKAARQLSNHPIILKHLRKTQEFRELGENHDEKIRRYLEAEESSVNKSIYQELLFVEATRKIIKIIKDQATDLDNFFELDYETTFAYKLYNELIILCKPQVKFYDFLCSLLVERAKDSSLVGAKEAFQIFSDYLYQQDEQLERINFMNNFHHTKPTANIFSEDVELSKPKKILVTAPKCFLVSL